MITIIQLCMLFLVFYIFWCEWDTTFSERIPSHILRISLCVLLSIAVYKIDFITDYHPAIQFSLMVAVIFSTFMSVKFILKKYQRNRFKQEVKQNLRRHNYEQ